MKFLFSIPKFEKRWFSGIWRVSLKPMKVFPTSKNSSGNGSKSVIGIMILKVSLKDAGSFKFIKGISRIIWSPAKNEKSLLSAEPSRYDKANRPAIIKNEEVLAVSAELKMVFFRCTVRIYLRYDWNLSPDIKVICVQLLIVVFVNKGNAEFFVNNRDLGCGKVDWKFVIRILRRHRHKLRVFKQNLSTHLSFG